MVSHVYNSSGDEDHNKRDWLIVVCTLPAAGSEISPDYNPGTVVPYKPQIQT